MPGHFLQPSVNFFTVRWIEPNEALPRKKQTLDASRLARVQIKRPQVPQNFRRGLPLVCCPADRSTMNVHSANFSTTAQNRSELKKSAASWPLCAIFSQTSSENPLVNIFNSSVLCHGRKLPNGKALTVFGLSSSNKRAPAARASKTRPFT